MSQRSTGILRTHLISQVGPHLEGQEVGLAGWVYRYRDLGSVVFIVLRDATGILQLSLIHI